MFGIHYAVDILHHHDGVVDHDADCQDKPKESEHVEREAKDEHHAECAHKRDGHRYDGDERGAPVLQRQEHDEDYEHQRLGKCAVDVVNRLRNIGGHVERNVVGDAFGEIARDKFHLFLHGLGHIDGVGAGEHVDVYHCRVAAVDAAFGGVARCFERHAGHVFEADDSAVGAGAYHDILKLGHRRQASTRDNRHGKVDARGRSLAEHAGCRLAVLVFERVLYVLYGEAKVGKFVGRHPYLHGVVASAHVRHAAYAGDAADGVDYVQRGIVAEVYLVKFGVVGLYRYRHKAAGRLLRHGNAVLHHFRRQARLGLLDTVLDVDGGKLGVGVDVERHQGVESAGVGARRVHIYHARRAVEFLLDGSSHGLGHGLGVGAGIGSRDAHHRGRDLRVLVDRQACQTDSAHYEYHDRQYDREYGMFKKKITVHCVSLLCWFPYRLPAARRPERPQDSPLCRATACGSLPLRFSRPLQGRVPR